MVTKSEKSEHARALSELGASKGGKARAAALSPEQRREIARIAARKRWGDRSGLPEATHSGDLPIGDLVIRCHVLEDGRRLLSGRSVTNAMGLTGRGQGMTRFLDSKSLKDFVGEKLALAIREPIAFISTSGGLPTHGYEAWVLPELCNSVIKADDKGLLKSHQRVMVERAKILLGALATVGIIALVDEATGYQADRAKDELVKILEAYISPELRPWTRRFPPEFFEEIYRLNGWKFVLGNLRGPRYVGKLINHLVYKKLPPGVLEELRRKNPVEDYGYRRHKHHQFLTPDIGHSHLDKQITAVMTLMRASDDKPTFRKLFEKAFGRQLSLPLPEEES